MKQVLATILVGAMVLAFLGPSASAMSSPAKTAPPAQTTPRAFVVEGKILATSAEWFELSITRVVKGAGLKVGEKLRITESAGTKFFAKGKAVGKDVLKAGRLLRVEGRSGKPSAYEATRVTVLK